MIRPEVRQAALRWGEALAGLALTAFGLKLLLTSYGIMPWIGGALAAAGSALVLTGSFRALFRAGRGGPGVVRVDEGQIAYFGPLDGGIVALSEMSEVALDARSHPPVWTISQPGQAPVHVPLNAEGAEALFDIFAALPGLSSTRLLAELRKSRRTPPERPVVIWQRAHRRLH